MASLELNDDGDVDYDYEDDYDSDEGAIAWERPSSQAHEGAHAQASLAAFSASESARTTKEPGRRFEHMKRLLAGASIPEPDYPHTIVAFRDSGFESLKQHEKDSMNFDDDLGTEIAQAVMENHHLQGYVSKGFLEGEEESDLTVMTLGGDVVRIKAPRIPKTRLPAGTRIEPPVIQLETTSGKVLKYATVRHAFEKDPEDPFQKILVVNEPLAKWARPESASKK